MANQTPRSPNATDTSPGSKTDRDAKRASKRAGVGADLRARQDNGFYEEFVIEPARDEEAPLH